MQPAPTGTIVALGDDSMETAATARHRTPTSFTVRQLSPALGAEILGVDLRNPIDATLKRG